MASCPYVAYEPLPQVAYGYPPQDQGASAQYPPPPVQGYPPQGYPPKDRADLRIPPVYPTQLPTPGYVYKQDQPAYNYQPQIAKTTVVVAAQPTTPETTTRVSLPKEDHLRLAICSLMFSLCTLIACGAFLFPLMLSLPALILSITSLVSIGKSQKKEASISIGLNVAAVVCTVVLLVAVVTPVAVTVSPHYCAPYYSSSYSTYCVPIDYSTRGSCSYYDSYYGRNCPSTSTYRCPSFYSYVYGSYCVVYSSSYYSCNYTNIVYGSCSRSSPRACFPFYSSSYSTYCVSYDTTFTPSSTPCSYYYSTSGYCPI